MKLKDEIPTLQATAAMLLPGMKHARSLLDVSIRVLQYFAGPFHVSAGHFTSELATDKPVLRRARGGCAHPLF